MSLLYFGLPLGLSKYIVPNIEEQENGPVADALISPASKSQSLESVFQLVEEEACMLLSVSFFAGVWMTQKLAWTQVDR